MKQMDLHKLYLEELDRKFRMTLNYAFTNNKKEFKSMYKETKEALEKDLRIKVITKNDYDFYNNKLQSLKYEYDDYCNKSTRK